MKLYLQIVVLLCVLIFVHSNDDKITEDEVTELINDYKFIYKNYEGEKNAPVST